jgi:hypothetical protein
MKIDYEKNLYIEIANFNVNEVVQVTNRKGIKSSIHITNIVKLSWHELQLLVSDGLDKFSKMVFLYREYTSKNKVSESVVRGNPLCANETNEIDEYINIFREYGCTKLHEVNEIIAKSGRWDDFKKIRSLNNHGKNKEIKGIQPQYYEIVCNILKVYGGKGLPLDGYKKY